MEKFEWEKECEFYIVKIDFFMNVVYEICIFLILIKSLFENVFVFLNVFVDICDDLEIMNLNIICLLDLVN